MRNTLIAICILTFKFSYTQTYAEAFTGYAYDMRGKQNLGMINAGVQFSFRKKTGYEFVVGFLNGFGVRRSSIDSSFTLNPSLPLYSNAEKKTHASLLCLYSNQRIKLFKAGEKQYVNINLLAGVRLQKVIVNYKYNNSDYVILNPGTSTHKFGLFVGVGVEYMYPMKNGRVFVQTNIISPYIRRKKDPPNTLNQPVPLSFNIGYSLKLKKWPAKH